ncbi:hypothetical protein [uncultured Bacteroides sp.]|uniref:hypothetical protein n=1 Tax=uncultured Bacteroides sp. TaxID=162156 RepID=UPI002615850F|nr:hypothetical protein [uncultured Bacteroides sp.]
MNRKTVNITGKRIERKITTVTLILSFIITNIIWIVGNVNTNEQPHTSITQFKENSGKDKKIANNQSFVSYPQAKLKY